MNRLRQRLYVRALEDRTAPATFTVMNLADSGADSLRDCVSKANAAAGADTITFQSGLAGTILFAGPISITGAVRIDGPGADIVSLDGNGTTGQRIFNISSAPTGTNIFINKLTLTGASTGSFLLAGGAIVGDDQFLEVNGCVFSGNKAGGGGAISMSGGTLRAFDSSFVNNSTIGPSGIGGAIFNGLTGAITRIQRCTVSGNTAGQRSGGIETNGYLLAQDSTFTGNVAQGLQSGGFGGAITATGTFAANAMRVLQCTISGNSAATDGGGIALYAAYGTANILNCTITNNTAGERGGGLARRTGTVALAIESTVVSGNSCAASPDMFSSGTVNVKTSAIGSGTGFTKTDLGGNLAFGTDLKLGPLADNGGAFLTRLPAGDSPLLDAGSFPIALVFDQLGIGFPRFIGSQVDIGAVERLNLVVLNTADSGPGSLRQTVQHANSDTGADTITFASNFQVGSHTIGLSSAVAINQATTIIGPVSANVTVSGKFTTRIFDIVNAPFGAEINISGLTLASGRASSSEGGAIRGDDQHVTITGCTFTGNSARDGGAIFLTNFGKLTASQSTFVGNSAADGGAIFAGEVTLVECSFNGNIANDNGGAIRGFNNPVTVADCTFTGNKAALRGGAIFLGEFGKLTTSKSTFAGNSGSIGGAVMAYEATLIECSLTGNVAAGGGAISVRDYLGGAAPISLIIDRCTLSGNGNQSIGSGGAVEIRGSFPAGAVQIRNSTISGNSMPVAAALDIYTPSSVVQIHNSTITGNTATDTSSIFSVGGIVVSAGGLQLASTIIAQNSGKAHDDLVFASFTNVPANNTIIGVAENGKFTLIGTGNETGSAAAPFNAKLGPLANNGGLTLTHLPLFGSPAINAGNNSAGFATDQRGVVRVVGSAADIGAAEVLPAVLSLVPSVATVGDAHVGPEGFTVTATFNLPMNTTILPAITFPAEVPAGSIAFSSGSWTNSTTYVAKFQVTDLGTMLNAIDLQISGGKDAFTNVGHAPFTAVDAFNLDTQNPLITSIASTTPNGTYGVGQSINVTLNFSEPVTLTGTLNITLDTGAVVSITGPVSGGNLTGTYVVGAGQNSPDLNVTAIALTGGSTLRDVATNNAVLTLPALNLANTANIVVSTPAGVSGFVVNNGDAQRSRLTKVVVNFSSLMNAATLAGPGGVTFTRTAGAPTGTVVDTSNGLIVFPASGMVSSVTLTFANVINAGVESGSLADGRWQLAIPAAGFTSVLNELNIFRFFGDADGDGNVAANDFIQFRLALGGNTAMFDFDGDGAVAASDFIQFRLRFGGSI